MSLVFYPHIEDSNKGSLEDRIEMLIVAADKFKAVTLDVSTKAEPAPISPDGDPNKKNTIAPRDLQAAYNWAEIAAVLREVREILEVSPEGKARKGRLLTKLSEIYEVLRGAKMPKLEAVRLALVGEKTQVLGSSGS
ncbi:MAG: hypothetical protein A3F43_04680 [Gammaproteobacteria bacterium RIFCSPHIGHO2_12_FULL_42_10]|nr:MAG: hypothetical protein A3F43_04680 [Gammaproteobacteria bacterium RIFCSPHIGHO2_12_FULL_42_10]